MDQTIATKARPGGAEDALERLISVTRSDMEEVNALIVSRADSHVDMVPELARYLIDAGGKRLRPMLTLAAATLFGNPGGDAIRFAAAVEFMHNATLLHDDVVDESEMRRGKPAARKVWGNQASVLVGDFLLGQAFLMMVETGHLKALNVLAKAAAEIAEGEVFQLVKANDLKTTRQDYHEVIKAKTATLFEAATTVGAMAGGAGETERLAMGRYGLELGLAFQLVDDALDFGGAAGTLGKNTGDDLREGKMTLPVILTLEAAGESERTFISGLVGKPDTDAETVAEVVSVMNRHGALAATLDQAETHARNAVAALDELQDGPVRTLLADTADFCVMRAY